MSILKVNTIQDKGGNNLLVSDGAGTISSGGLMTMTPAFRVLKTSNQNITSNTYTKITFDTETFDTDNAVASSTFTVPSGKAGKYFLGAVIWGDANAADNYQYGNLSFYLNGTIKTVFITDVRNNVGLQFSQHVSDIYDLSAGDTVEVYQRIADLSGDPTVLASTSQDMVYFYGYRIIGA